MISVLIVEADPMRCQLMASAFKHSRPHLDVVACASDSEAALSALKEREADVAAISANLRDGPKRGLEVVRRIRTTHPKTRVVVLLDYYQSDLIIEAFREGADGVVCREDSVEALCKCICKVNEGQIWIRTTELRPHVQKEAASSGIQLALRHCASSGVQAKISDSADCCRTSSALRLAKY
jgi:DNA-binding NarL/FixJ family response regulator